MDCVNSPRAIYYVQAQPALDRSSLFSTPYAFLDAYMRFPMHICVFQFRLSIGRKMPTS